VTAETLTIDISSHCNLRCVMCPLVHSGSPQRFIDFELFREIVEQLGGKTHVRLGWYGEPLLHPRAAEAIAVLRRRVRLVELTTNATLLDEAMAEALIEAGLDEMNVSLDGSTKALYESIRVGADFEQVIGNIERYLGKLPPSGRVNLVATLFDANLHDAEGLVLLAQRLGIQVVAFNLAVPHSAEMRSADRMDRSEIRSVLERAAAARPADQSHTIVPTFEASVGCRFLHPVVTPEGDVAPCSMLSSDRELFFRGQRRTVRRKTFGNLGRRSLAEILGSEEYCAFVETAGTDHRKTCEFCVMNTGYFCP